jgi:hypothetical protein
MGRNKNGAGEDRATAVKHAHSNKHTQTQADNARGREEKPKYFFNCTNNINSPALPLKT